MIGDKARELGVGVKIRVQSKLPLQSIELSGSFIKVIQKIGFCRLNNLVDEPMEIKYNSIQQIIR